MTLVSEPARPQLTSGDALRVALVGATGAVGTTLLSLMGERGFRPARLDLLASARSAGSTVESLGARHEVQDLAGFDFSGVDLAFFSAGTSVSRRWAGAAAAAGALVIDNTNAYRMDPDTPLVVPQVNGDLLARRPVSGVIANPNCSTIPLVRLLRPLQDRYGLRRVVAATYQAASGRGLSGVDELTRGAQAALKDPEGPQPADRFEYPLAFNVLPSIDVLLPDGFTLEEQKMRQESRKILGLPGLDISATCVRVPVVNCHSEAVHVELAGEADHEEVLALLRDQPEVTVYADGYPTPRTISDPDQVHVGRVRIDPENPHALWMWVVADNLRIGAALNAIQIAEVLNWSAL